MSDDVRNNTDAHRFEITIDGHTGKAWYRLSPGTITFTHTEVPDELSGKGVGSRLAKAALDYAKAGKLKVVPLCPFIAAYIKRHAKDYGDLVEASGEGARE